MAELSPEAQKLLTARKAAIAELKEIDGKERTVGDFDVIRLAGCRMLVEALTLRMLAGDRVLPSEFDQAQSMVDESLRLAGKRELKVEIEIVRGNYICAHCGKLNEDYTPPPIHTSAPAKAEGEALKAEGEPSPKAKDAPKATKIVPMAAPVRMLPRAPIDHSWKKHVQPIGGSNPQSDPHPYRSNGHPLPE
jgi:hypothetical protein